MGSRPARMDSHLDGVNQLSHLKSRVLTAATGNTKREGGSMVFWDNASQRLQPGDRVRYPGVKVDVYGTLQDIQDGAGVVLWDNGVLRRGVVLRNLRRVEEQ